MTPRLLIAAMALAVAAATPALAQTPAQDAPAVDMTISNETVRGVRDWLISQGLTVGEPVDQNGFPALPVSQGGLGWGVILFPCAAPNCIDVRFSAAFSNEGVTAEGINAWNADRRFLSAHFARTEAGGAGAVVNHDVVLLGPGGYDRLGVPLDIWLSGLAAFGLHVGYFAPPAEQ